MLLDQKTKTQLLIQVSKNELGLVFESLFSLLSENPVLENLIKLSRWHEDISQAIQYGTISYSEASIEKNKICEGLVSLLLQVSGENENQITHEIPTESDLPTTEENPEITPRDSFEDFSYNAVILKYALPPLPFEKLNAPFDRRIGKKTIPGLFELPQGKPVRFDWATELKQTRYFALLGDAGIGKSLELKRICYELIENGHFIPVFEPIRNREFLAGISVLPEVLEEKIVLVLDGLDESDIKKSKITIENFRRRFPKSKIIISCRSNAYSDTLPDFEVVYLHKLDQGTIQGYLKKRLGKSGNDFWEKWQKRYQWNPTQLIDNPFFLVSICNFVKEKNNQIPQVIGEVFEFMIEANLYKGINLEDKNWAKLYASCRESLERIAFVMECRGENFMAKQELETLVGDENERKILLEKSTLFDIRNGSYQFFHNNLQEYLAAKVLSRAKNFAHIQIAIAAKPDYDRLKWSWINTLSFLIGIWGENHPMKEKLFEWLAQSDLDSLIKIASFEKEKVPKAERERIFKLAFEQSKHDDSIIGSHQYRYWELAEFGESPEIAKYLVEELHNAKNSTVKCNALILLKSMNAYSVLSETRSILHQELLSNIYDFEKNTSTVRQFAMLALIELFDDIEKREANKMVKMFFDSNDAQERTATYQLIDKQGLQLDFMEKLVRRCRELEDHNWREDAVRLVDEDWQMEQCLEGIKVEEALVAFFEKYSGNIENEDGWFTKQKSLNLMLRKLTNNSISREGVGRIFEAMKGLFVDYFWYPSQSGKHSIAQFIEKNRLQSQVVRFCVENKRHVALPSQLLDEVTIEYLVQTFVEGKIERAWLEDYIIWAASNKDLPAASLVQKLNTVTEEHFALPKTKPPIDYAEIEKRKRLIEKNLYFNKEKFIAIVAEIFEKHGKDFSQEGEIYNFLRHVDEDGEDVFEKYPNSLIWFIDDHFGMSEQKLIGLIEKNWGWISVSLIKNFLIREKNNSIKYSESELNEQETAYIKTWCDQHQTTMDLSKNVTNGDITFTWFTIHCGFTHYPEEVYEQMIGSKVNESLLEFLEKSEVISFQKIKKAVLKLLAKGVDGGNAVYQSLKFVEKYKFEEALDMLPHFIETKYERFDNRDTALQTYISLGGKREYLLRLLENTVPEQNDYREQRLLDFFSTDPKEDFEKILLKKLVEATDAARQVNFARYLLRCGNLIGLQFLVKYLEIEKKSPFSYRIESTQYRVENPVAIPLLLRIFDFAYDKSIQQDDFDRVSNFARQMLQHLANCQGGKYFSLVIYSLKEYLKVNRWINEFGNPQIKWLEPVNLDALKEVQYFTKDLEFNYYQKQEVRTEDALKLFENF